MKKLMRFGVLSAATVLSIAVSTLIAAPSASAAGSPECVNGVYYLASTTLGANGGYEWVSFTNEASEVDGSFVFDQHVLGGVHRSAILPAYDSTTDTAYVTVQNLETSNETYAGWFNVLDLC